MKTTALTVALLISTLAYAQTTDYRTTEDGINQLINNIDFLEKMSNMSNEQIANTTIDKLFDEYVPEYRGFKADVEKLDLNNIYYVPEGEYSTKQLAGNLGKVLGMKDEEVNAFQSVFSGDYENVDMRTASSQLGNSLYKRGKDEGVDYVVDNTNKLLQEQFGSNEGASSLINIGTGILGNVIFSLTDDDDISDEKARQYKAAIEAQDKRRKQEQEVQGDAYSKGVQLSSSGWTKSLSKQNHIEALADYAEAIRLLNTSYMGGPELVKAYYKRAQTKMYMNDHRGAVIDYYFALNTAVKVFQKKWEPTPRVQDNILRGVGMETVDVFADKEIVDILMGRAYAKYQARNFTGAMVDCNNALKLYRAIDAKDADWKNHKNNFDPDDYTPQWHPLNNLIGLSGMVNMAMGNTVEAMEQYKYNISQITMANSMVSLGALPISFTRELIMAKAYAYYKQGDYDAAINLYSNVIANKTYVAMKGGNVATAHSGRGNIYLVKKDFTNALNDYNEAIRLKPQESMFYVNRGNCKLLMNDKDGAAKDFAIAKDPSAMKAVAKAIELANPVNQVGSYPFYMDTISKLAVSEKDEAGLLKLYETTILTYPDSLWATNSFISHIRTRKGSKDLVLEISSKVKGNGTASNLLKAFYFNLTGDNKQCMDICLKAIEAGLTFHIFKSIYPEFENNTDYCKHAQMLLKKEIADQHPKTKEMWQKNLKKHLEAPVEPLLGPSVNNMLIMQDYFNMGDATNTIVYADKDISGEGKTKYNNFLSASTIVWKIKSLLFLGRYKEAVVVAKKYAKPQKNYSLAETDLEYPFIKNIAADYCSYDTK